MPTVIGRVDIRHAQAFDALSEETLAFSADVYVDGRLVGQARNDGHGGCNSYSFVSRYFQMEFDAEMKAWGARHGITFEPDAAFIHCVAFGANPSDFALEAR